MPDTVQSCKNPRTSERRNHPRKQLWFPCIQLGDDNGGIILDISESGLAMQAVRSLAGDQLTAISFQLSESQTWIETRGRIAWISVSEKMAGVEFIGLPEEARNQIREWIPLKLHPSGSVEENPLDEKTERIKVEPPPAEPGSEIFVSESETTGHAEEDQGRHSLADDPAEVLLSRVQAQDAGTVSQHLAGKSTKPAVTDNARPKTSPALYVSYQARTSSREIKDHGLTTGSGKSRERIGLFLTTVLLLSALLSLASRLQKTGNSSRGTEVKAAGKVDEFSPSNSANSKTLSADPNRPLDQPAFVLQVGAMTHEENADALAESLLKRNFPVIVSHRGTDRFYRVVVGPYSDINSTLRVKEQLEKEGLDAFRTPWNP
jgi:hypothetical protein